MRGLPVHQEQRPVVAIDDNDISTTQWTRSDAEHEHIVKQHPWADFPEPSTE